MSLISSFVMHAYLSGNLIYEVITKQVVAVITL
jgi:hypothetical protein